MYPLPADIHLQYLFPTVTDFIYEYLWVQIFLNIPNLFLRESSMEIKENCDFYS